MTDLSATIAALNSIPGVNIDPDFAPVPIKAVAPPDPSKGCTFGPVNREVTEETSILLATVPTPTSKYAEFRVTVDVAVFCLDKKGVPHVLLIKRRKDPFKGCWCFPGGHVDRDENIPDAAYRELQEETGLTLPTFALSQGIVCGAPGRDPRGQYVTISYSTVLYNDVAGNEDGWPRQLRHDLPTVKGADDAAEARWIPLSDIASGLAQLGFDHASILQSALRNLPDNGCGLGPNARRIFGEAMYANQGR